MKYYGSTKVRFGFTGLYAWAGSGKDWFRKGAYLAVALAPVNQFADGRAAVWPRSKELLAQAKGTSGPGQK